MGILQLIDDEKIGWNVFAWKIHLLLFVMQLTAKKRGSKRHWCFNNKSVTNYCVVFEA